MSGFRNTPEVSLYAKLIFGERASLKPARGTPPLQAGGDRVARLHDALPDKAGAADGGAVAPSDGETAQ